jgi:ABC-type lipoprotein release transport system permease subunit
MFTIGAVFGILLLAFISGYHKVMIANSIKTHSGNIQIHKKGYHVYQNEKYFMPKNQELLAAVASEETVGHSATRVKCSGLISYTNKSTGVLILGITPEEEKKITWMHRRPQRHQPGALAVGKYIEADDWQEGRTETGYRLPGILVGSQIAEKLGLGIGYRIVLTAQAISKEINQKLFVVKGIFRTLDPNYDAGMVIVHIKNAQQLLHYSEGDYITEVVLSLKDDETLGKTSASLKQKLSQQTYEVLTWAEVSPHLLQLITLDNIQVEGTALVFFIVISIGLLTAIISAVFERFYEYGVMRAIGTTPSQLVGLILLENFLLALMGCILGTMITVPLTYYFHIHGIDFSWLTESSQFVAMSLDMTVYFDFNFGILLGPLPFIILFSSLITLYPALKAARLKIIEAIYSRYM